MFHDPETAGHPGEIATYNAVQQHYWWPGLKTFVIMSKVVGFVNSSKLTERHQNQLTSLLKGQPLLDLLQTTPWI